MSVRIGPQTIKTESLVGLWDVGSPRSFKGEEIRNFLKNINNTYGTNYGTYLRSVNNTQQVYIPGINKTVKTRVTDFYNDYSGGSGNCCPNVYNYDTGNSTTSHGGDVVSPSTLYTYSIVYKTTDGYTHPNYMYRYEISGAGTYQTEGGVHNNANRTSLGDGWYHAWGQFTTQAGTSGSGAYFNNYFFHYQYATYNTLYVASAQLIPGARIMPAKYQTFNVDSGRGRYGYYDITSVGTSNHRNSDEKPGGLLDISGKGHHAELRNGPSYDDDGGGCLVFDGANDGIKIEDVNFLGTPFHTMVAWVKSSNFNQNGFIFEKTTNGNVNTQYSYFFNGDNTFYYRTFGCSNGDITFTTSNYFTNGNWHHVVATYDGENKRVYVNGVQAVSVACSGAITQNNTGPAYIGVYGDVTGYYFNGKIAKVAVYDKGWTAADVLEDYNNTKTRFGL